jgi:hypothetical protein
MTCGNILFMKFIGNFNIYSLQALTSGNAHQPLIDTCECRSIYGLVFVSTVVAKIVACVVASVHLTTYLVEFCNCVCDYNSFICSRMYDYMMMCGIHIGKNYVVVATNVVPFKSTRAILLEMWHPHTDK